MSRVKYINSSGVNSATIDGDPGATLDGGNGDLGAVDTNPGPPFTFAIVGGATLDGAFAIVGGAFAIVGGAVDCAATSGVFAIGATATGATGAAGAADSDAILYFFIKSSAILAKFEKISVITEGSSSYE